jgi:uncharacterized protein YdeI (YjbR/CyaY-like superfamily)
MLEAASKYIEEVKDNGYWTILDTVEALLIPDDLEINFKHIWDQRNSFQLKVNR